MYTELFLTVMTVLHNIFQWKLLPLIKRKYTDFSPVCQGMFFLISFRSKNNAVILGTPIRPFQISDNSQTVLSFAREPRKIAFKYKRKYSFLPIVSLLKGVYIHKYSKA